MEISQLNNKDIPSFRKLQSHFMQIYLVLKLKPKKVLEFGIGSRFVSNILKQYCELTTSDINEATKPDIICDISNPNDLSQFEDNYFDLVMVCEVLEHISYDKIEEVLKSLKRISSKYVLISVPNQSNYLNLTLFKHGFEQFLFSSFISLIKRINYMFNKIFKIFNKFHYRLVKNKRLFKFNGQHHWELGIDKYSEKSFRKLLKKYFIIEQEGRLRENPWHHFFLLKKSKK